MGGASLRIKSSDGMYGIDDHLAIDRPSDIQTIRSIDFHNAFSKTNNWVSLHSDIIIGVNYGVWETQTPRLLDGVLALLGVRGHGVVEESLTEI